MVLRRKLKERQLRTVEEFPQVLIYKPQELGDNSVSVKDLYARILVRLEHLQNLFVTERLLIRRGHVDEGKLLAVSFDMVSLTLIFWTHKDRLAKVRKDFEWLVWKTNQPTFCHLPLHLILDMIHSQNSVEEQIANLKLGHGLRNPRWWHSMHGAPQPNFYREPPQQPQDHTVKHHQELEPFNRLPRLG